VLSGSHIRRNLVRCTWGGAMNAIPGTVRLRFVVGKNAEDSAMHDVLNVDVDEYLQMKSAKSGQWVKNRGRTYSMYSTWVKFIWFLRYAARQPEEAVAFIDDDVFVQPHMLVAHIEVLRRQAAANPADRHWIAGAFEWYSVRSETFLASGWARDLQSALYKAQRPWRNCSPSGVGWNLRPQGEDTWEAPLDSRKPVDACYGPFGFIKGPLMLLSSSVIRWDLPVRCRLCSAACGVGRLSLNPCHPTRSPRPLSRTKLHTQSLAVPLHPHRWAVSSTTFDADVARAARLAEGRQKLPLGSAKFERLPQDVMLGYWLRSFPGLRYVRLPFFSAWCEEFRHIGELRRLLVAHRVPWDQFAWLTEHTERIWRNAPTLPAPPVAARMRCTGAPCQPGLCAHLQTQRACAIDLTVTVKGAEAPDGEVRAVHEDAGCTRCNCWVSEGGTRSFAGGKCNFSRSAVPQLPAHCWASLGRPLNAAPVGVAS
jgi:hypothetical protein